MLQIDSQSRSLIESAATLRAQVVAKEVQLQGMRSYSERQFPRKYSESVMFGYDGTSMAPVFVRMQGAGTAMLSLTGIPVAKNHTVGSLPYSAPQLFSTDGTNTPIGVQPSLTTSLTTSSSTTDTVTLAGMTPSGHCLLQRTSASAAANLASTCVSSKGSGTFTVTHAAIAGMTFDIGCTSN